MGNCIYTRYSDVRNYPKMIRNAYKYKTPSRCTVASYTCTQAVVPVNDAYGRNESREEQGRVEKQ